MSLHGIGGSTQVGTAGSAGATESKFGRFKAALGEAKGQVANFFRGLPAKFSEATRSTTLSPTTQNVVDRHNEKVANDMHDTIGEMFGTRRPAGPENRTDAERILGHRTGRI